MTPDEILSDYANGIPDVLTREALEPPPPGGRSWDAVNRAIHRGIVSGTVRPRTHGTLSWLRRGLLTAGGIAAAIVISLILSAGREEPTPALPVSENERDEVAVLPLASEEDVIIERIAGSGNGLIVGDAPLALAGEDDIRIEGTEPHPAWPGGSPRTITAPGDAPMIFAAKGR